jgi:hypothetical protein
LQLILHCNAFASHSYVIVVILTLHQTLTIFHPSLSYTQHITMSHPTLLTLPRELRFVIYSYLTNPEPVSYPFAYSPITSISHRPPPSSLQRTCRFLHGEITSYFYATTTLGFIVRGGPCTYADDKHAAAVRAIRSARRVNVLLDLDFATSTILEEGLRATVQLLVEEGKRLEVLVVSVRNAREGRVDWDAKARMLQPLGGLEGKVKFMVGEVVTAEDKEEELRTWLGRYLEGLNGDEV